MFLKANKRYKDGKAYFSRTLIARAHVGKSVFPIGLYRSFPAPAEGLL